jgi:hypothetical protein
VLGKGKPKDAYDIYFCIKHYQGGVKNLVNEFKPYIKHGLVIEMLEKLHEKFYSPEHVQVHQVCIIPCQKIG